MNWTANFLGLPACSPSNPVVYPINHLALGKMPNQNKFIHLGVLLPSTILKLHISSCGILWNSAEARGLCFRNRRKTRFQIKKKRSAFWTPYFCGIFLALWTRPKSSARASLGSPPDRDRGAFWPKARCVWQLLVGYILTIVIPVEFWPGAHGEVWPTKSWKPFGWLFTVVSCRSAILNVKSLDGIWVCLKIGQLPQNLMVDDHFSLKLYRLYTKIVYTIMKHDTANLLLSFPYQKKNVIQKIPQWINPNSQNDRILLGLQSCSIYYVKRHTWPFQIKNGCPG